MQSIPPIEDIELFDPELDLSELDALTADRLDNERFPDDYDTQANNDCVIFELLVKLGLTKTAQKFWDRNNAD